MDAGTGPSLVYPREGVGQGADSYLLTPPFLARPQDLFDGVDGYLRASLIGAIPICSKLSQTTFVTQMRTKLRSIALWLSTLWSNEAGQDVAEYAVMMAVILVIVVSTVKLIGVNTSSVFSQVGSAIQ